MPRGWPIVFGDIVAALIAHATGVPWKLIAWKLGCRRESLARAIQRVGALEPPPLRRLSRPSTRKGT